MFGLQPLHLIVILIVALLLFGPDQLPKLARALGETLREFRKATEEAQKPVEEVKETVRSISETAKDALTENPLLVFVSSLMNPQCDDLTAERAAAKKALQSFPLLTRPWLFEDSPAVPETARRAYLKKVKDCDLFVLVVGKEITYPVLREYATARKCDKPRLVFLKKCQRTPATDAFIAKIRQDVKYKEFNAADDLNVQIIVAVATYLIQKGRENHKLSANDIVILTAFLNPFPKLEFASSPAPSEPVTAPRAQFIEPEPPHIEKPGSLFTPQYKYGKDGKRMILIPAGEFLRGTSDADILEMTLRFNWKSEWFDDEKPQRKIYLDAYYIDETPVTNAEYKKFVDATGREVPSNWDKNWRTFPPGKDNHPVVGVTWDDANAYARWAGCRLPSEAEWEKAARGTDGRRYPWGNEFDATRCNSSESKIDDTTPVGKYSPRGDSPCYIKDMAGNVWEWCADWYDADYYKNSPVQNPKGPDSANYRVVRGGSWNNNANFVRAAVRGISVIWNNDVGFRCVE